VDDLTRLLELSDDIAEFRSAKEVATFFIEQENRDQAQWVTDLLNRMEVRDRDQICVLVLDTVSTMGTGSWSPCSQTRIGTRSNLPGGVNDDQVMGR